MTERAATQHADAIRRVLAFGPGTALSLANRLGLSQPTVSRAIAELGDTAVRLGAARSIQYALRDTLRGLPNVPVYRVDASAQVQQLGVLVPVRPEGYVFRPAAPPGGTGARPATHSEGLPWWLQDMRPQGFLGRAYASRHAAALGLPPSLSDWGDTQVVHALLQHGHDAVGNLLLGDAARDAFVHAPAPVALRAAERAAAYVQRSDDASRGELPGSSAGGEQPKFLAYAEGDEGQPRHVLVKFSVPGDHAVSRRWRDLLLAEHHALQTLREAGVAAAHSTVVDRGTQRFLEVERFDRVGPLGRRALFSLAALEAEFIGDASAPWPVLAHRLAQAGHITRAAADTAALLYAFGTLVGNTDMHHGNLSFLSDAGPPCDLAPAYDMLPMGLAPRSGGALPHDLPAPRLHAAVPNATWRQALALAQAWHARLQGEERFTSEWAPCQQALNQHLALATTQLQRLG